MADLLQLEVPPKPTNPSFPQRKVLPLEPPFQRDDYFGCSPLPSRAAGLIDMHRQF